LWLGHPDTPDLNIMQVKPQKDQTWLDTELCLLRARRPFLLELFLWLPYLSGMYE